MSRAPFQALVFPFRRGQQGQLEYAIFRRADLNVWQGIAGGGEDDETPKQAALRELREETGVAATAALLRLDAVGAIGVEHFGDHALWDPRLRTIPEHSFGVALESPDISLSAEHRDFAWLGFEAALTCLEWESNRVALCELHNRLNDATESSRIRAG